MATLPSYICTPSDLFAAFRVNTSLGTNGHDIANGTSLRLFFGGALLSLGVLMPALYIAVYIVPPVVWVSLPAMTLGAFLLACEGLARMPSDVRGEIAKYSILDFSAVCIHYAREQFWTIHLMNCLPPSNHLALDLETILARSLKNPWLMQVLRKKGVLMRTLPLAIIGKTTKGPHEIPESCVAHVSAPKGSCEDENATPGFEDAVKWLQKEHLGIGLSDQLRIYGLFRQARDGDFSEEAGASAERAPALVKAKLESWRCHQGVHSREKAQALLVDELLSIDSGFRNTQPALAARQAAEEAAREPALPLGQSLLPSLLFSIVELRLPSDFVERAARFKRRVFQLMLLLTCFAEYRRRRRSLKGINGASAVVALGFASSVYFGALAQSIPGLCYVAAEIAARRASARPWQPCPQARSRGPAMRMLQHAQQLLLPPVSPPIFQD